MTCPKNRRKKLKRLKCLNISIPPKFLHSFLPNTISKKSFGNTTIQQSQNVYQMQCDLRQELPKILGNGPQQTKILTTDHFSYCLHSSMLTNITKQDKNNWVHLHVTLIIPSNYNISHSLICTKTWRKGLKRLKILRIDHFSYV